MPPGLALINYQDKKKSTHKQGRCAEKSLWIKKPQHSMENFLEEERVKKPCDLRHSAYQLLHERLLWRRLGREW